MTANGMELDAVLPVNFNFFRRALRQAHDVLKSAKRRNTAWAKLHPDVQKERSGFCTSHKYTQ